MKIYLLCLSFLALISSVASQPAGTPAFSLAEKGAVITVPGAGRFTFEGPTLMLANGKDEKPVYSAGGDGAANATYASGLAAIYRVESGGARLAVRFSGAPAGAKSLKFAIGLPLKLNQGGRYAFGQGGLAPFPVEPAEQFVGQRSDTGFTLVDPLDCGFVLKTPWGLHQLQDNRVRGWGASFVYIFYTDIQGKKEGEVVFNLSPATVTASTNQGASASRKFLVDRYGQSARKDYPGKVKSDAELRGDVELQRAALPAPGGPGKDAYGGIAGSGTTHNLKKTGFFHVGAIGERQVLVTPEGNAFFHIAVCGLHNIDDYTVVQGREHTYEWLPDTKGEFATAWKKGNPGVLSFQIANWIRKYGKPYDQNEWLAQSIARLRAWGFNSTGAFSLTNDATRRLGVPYTAGLPIESAKGVKVLPDQIGAAKLIDPFAPETVAALDKAFAAYLPTVANDPLLIGFFLGNEQHFELLPRLIPTYKANVAAKVRLVEMLREKYGDIAAFNAAWKPAQPFADFESAKDTALFVRTEAGAADMHAFLKLYLESYYALVRDTFKKYDSNHLLIGSRWTPGTSGHEDIVRIGGKHLDVVSINYYTHGIDKAFLTRAHEWSGGRPIILSEWHYGSTENGLGGGAIEVKTLADRGHAYRNYLEQSASLPFVVGSEWFIYADQSITGRWFSGFHGEGGNTGLVDVTDRPYADLVTAAKLTNDRLYDVMLGKEKPYAFQDPKFTGQKTAGANRVVRVHRAPPDIALDGTTVNWPGVPTEPVDSTRLVNGLPNPALRGDFRLCWDERFLYVHVQVKDPTPLQNKKEHGALWAGDGVELFVGGKDLTTTSGIIFDDRQVMLGAAEKAPVFVALAGGEADGRRLAQECRATVVKDVAGSGYVIAAALPWSIFGVTPENGREFFFDLAIDNSDDGHLRIQQLMWNGNQHNSTHRGAWGRARLVTN
jgi:hypothetical protein